MFGVLDNTNVKNIGGQQVIVSKTKDFVKKSPEVKYDSKDAKGIGILLNDVNDSDAGRNGEYTEHGLADKYTGNGTSRQYSVVGEGPGPIMWEENYAYKSSSNSSSNANVLQYDPLVESNSAYLDKGETLGRKIHNALNSDYNPFRLFGRFAYATNDLAKPLNYFAPMAYGGLFLGGLGAGIGSLYGLYNKHKKRMEDPNYDEATDDSVKSSLKSGLLAGALAGLGLGFMSGDIAGMKKKSNSVLNEIINKINSDSSLSFGEKNSLIDAVVKLPSGALWDLSKLLSVVTGASIGGVVAKFLMGFGTVGTVLSSIVGGLIGSGLSSNRGALPPDNPNGKFNIGF